MHGNGASIASLPHTSNRSYTRVALRSTHINRRSAPSTKVANFHPKCKLRVVVSEFLDFNELPLVSFGYGRHTNYIIRVLVRLELLLYCTSNSHNTNHEILSLQRLIHSQNNQNKANCNLINRNSKQTIPR